MHSVDVGDRSQRRTNQNKLFFAYLSAPNLGGSSCQRSSPHYQNTIALPSCMLSVMDIAHRLHHITSKLRRQWFTAKSKSGGPQETW